jgi:xanthine dehydrogenase accessory factor
MPNELEIWQFIASRLEKGKAVMLLVVGESSGSSPGRAGYKMAVGSDGELVGSIGGGVMEVRLVEQARSFLSVPPAVAGGKSPILIEQEHRKNAEHPSGMICSGRQTVIVKQLDPNDLDPVNTIIDRLERRRSAAFEISNSGFRIIENTKGTSPFHFSKASDVEFVYREKIGFKHDLYIIGGGHCALALSEIAAKLDFRVSIFDDRPELNTIEKNDFADEITIVDTYEKIGEHIAGGKDTYVVVMTLGYKFDEVVIRQLIGRKFKYFGVLGSHAKMKTLLTALEKDGFPADALAAIRTPIGLPINSHTPEEIAVSIAAEIIQVKNA